MSADLGDDGWRDLLGQISERARHTAVEKAELATELRSAETVIKKIDAEKKELKGDLGCKNDELEKKENELRSAETVIREMTAEKKELKRDLGRKDEELEKKEKELSTSRQQQVQLEDQLAAENKELKGDLGRKNEELEEKEKQLSTTRQQQVQLEGQIASREAAHADLKNIQENLHDDLSTKQQTINALEEQVATLRDEIAARVAAREATQAELKKIQENLHDDLSAKLQTIHAFEEQVATLKSEIAAKGRRQSQANDVVGSTESSTPLPSLSDEIRALNARIKKRVGKLPKSDDAMTEKLERQEFNYRACANSLADAIEKAGEGLPSTYDSDKHVNKTTEPIAHEKALDNHMMATEEAPGEGGEAPNTANYRQTRFHVPAFTINPDRDAPEERPRDIELRARDNGASSTKFLDKWPPKNDMPVEILQVKEWKLTPIADLPGPDDLWVPDGYVADQNGAYDDEGCNNGTEMEIDQPTAHQEKVDHGAEQPVEELKPVLPVEMDGGDLHQMTVNSGTEQLEGQSEERAAVVMSDEKPAIQTQQQTRPAFDWKAFHGTADNPISVESTPEPGEVDMEGEDSVAVAGTIENPIERKDSPERHDSHFSTDKSDPERTVVDPAPQRTSPMSENLRRDQNDRGHFLHPDDQRRDDLRDTRRRDVYRPTAAKRRRSHSTAPRKSRKSRRTPVCLSCWRRDEWCTSEGQCGSCKEHDRGCLYMCCRFGSECSSPRCVYLHQDQYKEWEKGDWDARRGSLGTRGSW